MKCIWSPTNAQVKNDLDDCEDVDLLKVIWDLAGDDDPKMWITDDEGYAYDKVDILWRPIVDEKLKGLLTDEEYVFWKLGRN